MQICMFSFITRTGLSRTKSPTSHLNSELVSWDWSDLHFNFMPDLSRLAVAGWFVKTGNLQLRYIYDIYAIWTLERSKINSQTSVLILIWAWIFNLKFSLLFWLCPDWYSISPGVSGYFFDKDNFDIPNRNCCRRTDLTHVGWI